MGDSEWGNSSEVRCTFETGEEMSAKTRTLDAMPEEVKTLYAQILAAQSLVDEQLDSKEIADIYMFMSQIDLGPASRERVRRYLVAGEPPLLELVSEVVSKVGDNDKDAIAFSIIKDMVRVSGTDRFVSTLERESIDSIADKLFGYKAAQVVALAEEAVEHDKAIIKGDASINEFEKHGKQVAAQAAAIGVPIAAVYFSGSVVGLSAAGITSGLAALGLGGVLGLSAMVTGIGGVVVAGVVTYRVTQWAVGGKEREFMAKREHMIQEVMKLHQKAIAALAEDINGIAAKLEEYTSKSERNERRLDQLKDELRVFKSALEALENRKERYVA